MKDNRLAVFLVPFRQLSSPPFSWNILRPPHLVCGFGFVKILKILNLIDETRRASGEASEDRDPAQKIVKEQDLIVYKRLKTEKALNMSGTEGKRVVEIGVT